MEVHFHDFLKSIFGDLENLKLTFIIYLVDQELVVEP